MPWRRADLVVALAGAAVAAGVTAVWGQGGWQFATAIALGAALGGSRARPRATWLVAAALLLVMGALGAPPGEPIYLLGAAHAFCAGRWDRGWGSYGGLVVLAGAGVVSGALAHGAEAGVRRHARRAAPARRRLAPGGPASPPGRRRGSLTPLIPTGETAGAIHPAG